jgi:hypothetical protein
MAIDNQAGADFRQFPVPTTDNSGRNSEAWGGYGTGWTTAPNGARQATGNGYDQDTDRYQGLARAAANVGAYQIDYGQADDDAAYGQHARNQQRSAIDLMRDTANGSMPSQAQLAGQNQLNAGAQAQQAGAMSMRGGSLAQAAAMQRQQSGQGAYIQQGNQMLDAQRAQEMAAARQQYMQATEQQRAQDQQSQGLQQQRADAQNAMEQGQRDLNDQTSLGYDKMGADTQKQSLKQQVNDYSLAGQRDASRAAADQADQDRTTKKYAAYGGAVASWIGGGIGSDERMKQGARPMMLSDAAAKANAWDLGHNAALDEVQQMRMRPPAELKALGAKGNRLANAIAGAKGDAWDEAHGKSQHIMQGQEMPTREPQAFRHGDPNDMTRQLADGLAPYEYEYKPGFDAAEGQKPGEKNVGPMAQNMAANPVTGAAVSQRPDGLLQIDMKKATKLSLAAAGHNARKLQEQQAQIDALKGGR